MRREEIIEAVKVRPFQPFCIHVSDGAAFEIRHPEMVMVTRTSALVGLTDNGSPPPAIERFMLVDLVHITRIEQIESSASS